MVRKRTLNTDLFKGLAEAPRAASALPNVEDTDQPAEGVGDRQAVPQPECEFRSRQALPAPSPVRERGYAAANPADAGRGAGCRTAHGTAWTVGDHGSCAGPLRAAEPRGSAPGGQEPARSHHGHAVAAARAISSTAATVTIVTDTEGPCSSTRHRLFGHRSDYGFHGACGSGRPGWELNSESIAIHLADRQTSSS